jgi:PD-(D/E)XK nuclease superfamily
MLESPVNQAVLWTIHDWVEAIARLHVTGPLPCRTVLVPRERAAHALRRELLRAGLDRVLAGSRFLSPLAAAVELLRSLEVAGAPGEESLRSARLLALFRQELPLVHFPTELLRSRPGWDEAFAETILDLEGVGLRPEDLTSSAEARLRDVATIWHALNESAGSSWTAQRVFREATVILEQRPELWPFPGSALVAVDGHETAAQATFLRTIPSGTVALIASRPLRERYLRRVEALYGSDAAEALRAAQAPRAQAIERDLLASYLFEPPAVLADPTRPRSTGPDGTVDIEEHAGVEEELEATADWVSRRIFEGTPLEDIAVLVPALDPLAGLLSDRLARLPFADGTLPVYVAGGLPLTGATAGARLLAVVRALRAHMAGDAFAAVLPALRPVPEGERHLSHGAAMDLAWSLGTAGGNPARPEGALEWALRAGEREPELAAQLRLAQAAGDDPERAGLARQARDIERLLRDLRAVRPAIEALVGIARLVLTGADLAQIWTALGDFAERWLLQPGASAPAHALVAERLSGSAADPAYQGLVGDDALRLIEEAILSTRLTAGRFGDPAVYVGTVHGAAGLPFRAVRIIGLAEGHLPSVPREDPVLPDRIRAGFSMQGLTTLPTAADRTLEALHALDRVIRDSGRHVALSFPRRDTERTDREPAAVLLEAAAALGRPNAVTGAPGRTIPDLLALRRDAFLPALVAWRDFRRSAPLGETAWQDGIALAILTLPLHWQDGGARALGRIAALWNGHTVGPMDGLLGDAAIAVPGLTAERPISPSRLETLLQCPHHFLFAHLLGLEEPAQAPPLREVGQPAYGALVHRLAEVFYRTHGAEFCARKGTLDDWLGRADPIVEREFEAFLAQYPLSALFRGLIDPWTKVQ